MKEQVPFRITFGDAGHHAVRAAMAEKDFRLSERRIAGGVLGLLRPHERDLLRIASAVYTVDRLQKRKSSSRGISRDISLEVEVCDADFWNDPRIHGLVRSAIQQITDDFWDISFKAGGFLREEEPYFRMPFEAPTVCLYSGGLDSAAGLATRLRTYRGPMVAVTAQHQPGQRGLVTSQLATLATRYGTDVFPLAVRTALINPPRMSKQESSQRCRSFLFMSLGGIVASLTGASAVEVYENGAGVVNLPLMTGMLVGSRTTKSVHPAFLRIMSSLVSQAAGREVEFCLPYRNHTKAEITRTLAEDGLSAVAADTVSCVHYPRRVRGSAKQCGWCPGCIGRRQAILHAGVDEHPKRYEVDLFGEAGDVASIPPGQLYYLKAMLMQVEELTHLREDGTQPDIFRRHVTGTHLLGPNEGIGPWVGVMQRYRDEWLELIQKAHRWGLVWSNWVADLTCASS